LTVCAHCDFDDPPTSVDRSAIGWGIEGDLSDGGMNGAGRVGDAYSRFGETVCREHDRLKIGECPDADDRILLDGFSASLFVAEEGGELRTFLVSPEINGGSVIDGKEVAVSD
jgi:hypothetical protein